MDDLGQTAHVGHELAGRALHGGDSKRGPKRRCGSTTSFSSWARPRRGVDGVAVLGRSDRCLEDLAAAFGLLQHQARVLGDRIVGGRVAQQLLGHHLDGGQRRAQLVGGGGGQSAQRRQPLLARQHVLGDGQRQFHACRLRRRVPGIAGGERRCPVIRARPPGRAGRRRQIPGPRPRRPGQGQGPEEQGHRQRGAASPATISMRRVDRVAGRHRRRARSAGAEGVVQAARERQQDRQLHDVEAEVERRLGRRAASRRPPRASRSVWR